MPVFINNVDDYLGPSQACVNPLFASPPKKESPKISNAHLVSKVVSDDKATVLNDNTTPSTTAQKVVQNRRIRQRRKPRIIKCEDDDDNKTSAAISKQSPIRLDNDNESTAPTNVIDSTITTQQQTQTTQTIKKKATVSLSDCLSCSGCVTSAEAVLLDHHSIDKLREIVASDGDSQQKKEKGRRRKVAFTISSASLADLYRHLYLENATSSGESSNDVASDDSLPTTIEESTIVIPTRQEFLSNITSFLQSEFNATIIVDGTLAQHISLMESASEFCYRYKKTKQSKEEDCMMDLDEETSKKKLRKSDCLNRSWIT